MPTELRLAAEADRTDAGAFLARVLSQDLAALVRLRCAGARLTLLSWLPYDVLVSRSVSAAPAEPGRPEVLTSEALRPHSRRGATEQRDAVVLAASLLEQLDEARRTCSLAVSLPAGRELSWRGALPPATGWRVLDILPSGAVHTVVRAGVDTFRRVATSRAAATAAGEQLLAHDAVVVDDAEGASVGVPLRALHAAVRMNFLPTTDDLPPDGPATDPVRTEGGVAVSVRPGWLALHAPYGSSYVRRGPVLRLLPA